MKAKAITTSFSNIALEQAPKEGDSRKKED